MSRFRMVSVGEEIEVGFVCSRCSAPPRDEPSFDTYNRPWITEHREGICVSCGGRGFLPDMPFVECYECHGSGICPECGGLSPRDFEALPGEELEEWRSVIGVDSDLSASDQYRIAASLYRKW